MKLSASIYFCLLTLFAQVMMTGCREKDASAPVQETGSVTDVEGNTYRTVKIGDQWWMAENLRVRTYRNGNPIPNVTDSSDWVSRTNGAYCVYENGNTQSEAPGFLYNWFAVSSVDQIAPEGWHVATDEDWKKLEQSQGMNSVDAGKSGWRGSHEGEKLKIASPLGWTIYGEVWSTNESGFSALAGSCRLPNSTYGQPGLFSTGFWWTATAEGSGAWYRYLDYKKAGIFRSHDSLNYGLSIRCVKD